jgi:hypothetical protein
VDEHERPAGAWALRQVAVLVAALLVLAAIVYVVQRQRDPGEPTGDRVAGLQDSPSSSELDDFARDVDATHVLAQQAQALAHSSAHSYRQTWDSGRQSQRAASTIFANLRALQVRRMGLQYVAADPSAASPAGDGAAGAQTWDAQVAVSWRLSGIDRSDAHSTLTMTFVRRGDLVKVVAMSARPGEREPIWLTGPLRVLRSDRTVVAATNMVDARRIDQELRRAAIDVRKVIPSWRGSLAAYAPATREQFDALMGANPDAYAGIAAVTTTVDGSRRAQAPVAIVVNPVVFQRLGPIGRHVVVTHESTHVATGATTVTMPLWVAEGFADYVGVGSVDVPLRVAAQAAIRDARLHGPPTSLPSDADFSSTDRPVEVAYEQAWLALRAIADEQGRDRLVAFYRDVVDHPRAVWRLLRRDAGMTRVELTRDWRANLEALVDGR